MDVPHKLTRPMMRTAENLCGDGVQHHRGPGAPAAHRPVGCLHPAEHLQGPREVQVVVVLYGKTRQEGRRRGGRPGGDAHVDGGARHGVDEHRHRIHPAQHGVCGHLRLRAVDAGNNGNATALSACVMLHVSQPRKVQVASTLCLAIASRALQPMLLGIEMFQVQCTFDLV